MKLNSGEIPNQNLYTVSLTKQTDRRNGVLRTTFWG